MTLFFVILLALGLSIDSFAVSLSCGLCSSTRLNFKAYRFALTLAFIQGLMLFLGWLVTSGVADYIKGWDYWVAFSILVALGGKVLWDSLHIEESDSEECCNKEAKLFTFRRAVLLGIATSIDALASGVAVNIAGVNIVDGSSQILNLLLAVVVTILVTFIASIIGLSLGRGVGRRYNLNRWSEVVAGVILILLGVKILLENL